MSEQKPGKFKGMTREGFHAYVRFAWEQEGRPKYQIIIDQAAEHNADVKLTTSTISATLKGQTFPRLPTAQALGLGIGGPELSAEFEVAWRVAQKNHREQRYENGRFVADIAQKKAEDKWHKKQERISRAAEGRYPSWWPKHRLLRGDKFSQLVTLVMVFLTMLWVLLWEYPIWRVLF